MQRFAFSSLRVMLALLIFLALVPVLVFTLSTDLEERELAIANVEDNVQRIAQYAAGTQEQVIEGTRKLLVALARLPEVRRQNAGFCSSLFADMLQEYPRYTSLGAALPDGRLFCSALHPGQTVNVAGQGWFQRALHKREFAIGASHIGPGTSPRTLNFAYPVLDLAGKVQAVVFAAMDLQQLDQIASEVELPEAAEFLMLAQNSTILAHDPDPEQRVGSTAAGSALASAILQKRAEDVVELPGLDGVSRLYAFMPLRSTVDTGLYVAVGIPTAIAYGEANRVLVEHLVALLAVTLAVLLLVWFGSDWLIFRRVRALDRAAQRLSQGDMAARTGLVYGSGELDRLAGTFDTMAATLEERTRKLRSLASELSLAEERERRRIATELHDRVGQTLAISKIKLGILKNTAATIELTAPIEEIRQLIEQAIRDTRSLIFEISSPILYELGFEAALEWLTEQLQKQHGIAAHYVDDGRSKPLDHDIRIMLFQVANELLTNVAKHAKARSVTVATAREENAIRLTIEDDGVGFDTATLGLKWGRTDGFGLFSIRERLKYVNGSIEFESQPGKGTCVVVKGPLGEQPVG